MVTVTSYVLTTDEPCTTFLFTFHRFLNPIQPYVENYFNVPTSHSK
jgi:hypothetical protein